MNNRFLLSKQAEAAHYFVPMTMNTMSLVVPKIKFVYHKIYIFKKVKSFLNKFKVQRPLHGNRPKRKGSTTVDKVVVYANRTPHPLFKTTTQTEIGKKFHTTYLN